jgi:hypothetical protein
MQNAILQRNTFINIEISILHTTLSLMQKDTELFSWHTVKNFTQI